MQSKNKLFTVTLLSLAIAATFTACSSTDESVVADASTAAAPAAASSGASNSKMEEIQVTGSRITRDAATSEGRMARNAAIGVAQSAAQMAPAPYIAAQPPITENYADITDNGIKRSSVEPVSTFSIDVDTGSYSNVRRFLNNGQLPPADAVRTEELVNYFAYEYPAAATDGAPFSVVSEIAASPWHPGRHLLQIGIEAVEPSQAKDLRSNLVFLVDVSGSMNSPDKLDLLKTSLKLLTHQLDKDDTIALVVYAGASGVVLEPTTGDHTAQITYALDRLQAGGGTNGEAGIQLAYSLAQQQFIDGGINRVLLATDGDFNVGVSNFDDLKKLIEDKRKTGISLTTLGFGTGNYNDQLMEQLADAGNGNYAYIDNINEARKVLVDEMASTLQTVAKDVKIQIEFNPSVVSEYRLVGYENRVLAQEDFNNDKIDAGEIGAGHGVTALYELTLVGSNAGSVDPLRYGPPLVDRAIPLLQPAELGWLKLRYKQPAGGASELLERPLLVADIEDDLDGTSADYRFAAAVAGFAQLLRDNQALGDFDYEDVIKMAMTAKQDDEFGYRSEFINLVKTAQALATTDLANR
ncbi:MAG: VWA domain-containing protein [Pseudomonadota bacterium]